ncbi:MAG TPA: M14 metallopeptidase family protein [Vicinamibacterales bacterium]|nr:M14 metallopeptidase family protein [Vicinamibacterales bacterium]
MRTVKRHFLLAFVFALVTAGAVPLAKLASAPAQAPQTTAAPPRLAASQAAARITTPKEEWGQNVGDDYFLANYQQLMAYWRKLEKESPRIHLEEIGRTAMKKPHLMAIITAPENYKNLAKYKDISRRLSLAEGLTDDQARALARDGKAVVWIDGGLHASEVLGAQQLLETTYQLVSGTDPETTRILNDVIVLVVSANPDGMDLVSDAYMKHTGTTGGHPGLYNFYAGHDNNRDSYMNALPETTNMSRIMYREWFPQVMYNHHQSGPQGSVMFAPPFRDPHNFNIHPLVIAGIDLVGAAMHTRFITEGKPGVTSRRGANYSTWWNGGLRTTAYFHNQVGILTETIGSPTPGQAIPFTPNRHIADSNNFFAIAPQPWKFRNSIDYSITANRAILDLASRYRETLLYRIYRMGADSIKWGTEDHWTFTPHKLERIQAALPGAGGAGAAAGAGGGRAGGGGGGGRGGGGAGDAAWNAYRRPEHRDPRGFILPAGHEEFGTSVRFVNTLIKSGIAIHRATAAFTVGGKQYPAGSFVVKSAQAFRPHIMDMFEPQDHPDDIPFPGAPPIAPYDVAGYTLAYQMGVVFDRILDGFDGPFEKLTDFAKPPAGSIRGAQSTAGYYFSHKSNDSFIAINRLLNANEDVTWLWNGPMGYGTFYVASKPTTRAILDKAATDLGVSFEGTATAPTGPSAKLRKLRIGLFDTYGGGMPSGWTRLLLENFEFPFDVVYPPMLDAGNLRAKYDVLVFNEAGITAPGGGGRGGGRGGGADAPPAGGDPPGQAGRGGGRGAGAQAERDPNDKRPARVDYPEEYTRRRGNVTPATLEKVKQFVDEGGTVITIGSASEGAIGLFALPLTSHVTVGRTEYYVPGSVMRVSVDPKNPLAHGYGTEADIFFDNSPVWRINPSAGSGEVRTVAWFANGTPLRSGWAWGQKHLDKGIQVVEANVGKGRVLLFGNDLLFRTQPHGNYKFFFNGLYLSVADGMKAGMGQ